MQPNRAGIQQNYLLRQILEQINGIHFNSTDEIHTLGHLYESMLKEMRDAAGDSGEFYTPRAVVRFMVKATDPRLGETVLDPAAGTGGFLVEAFAHLQPQAKKAADFDTRRGVRTTTGSNSPPIGLVPAGTWIPRSPANVARPGSSVPTPRLTALRVSICWNPPPRPSAVRRTPRGAVVGTNQPSS